MSIQKFAKCSVTLKSDNDKKHQQATKVNEVVSDLFI